MEAHTPGPWKEKRGTIYGGPRQRGLAIVKYFSGGTAQEHAEDDANARLIAAAPDLLAACKSVLWWADYTGAMSEPEDERDVLDPLREAVERASSEVG